MKSINHDGASPQSCRQRFFGLLVLCVLSTRCVAVEPVPANESVTFEKIVLTDRYYCDGISAGDINSDGHQDIVAGPFWYEGPEFRVAHEFYEAVVLEREPSPSNSMFSFVHDFSGDGRPDILVLGRVHKHPAMWYENPGAGEQLWKSHFAFERVRGESPDLVDIDRDGIPEIIAHWDGCWGLIQPQPNQPYDPWKFKAIGPNEDWPQFYHGEGTGDVNNDGHVDLVINDGWYEQPSDSRDGHWKFHRGRFSLDRGGAQMFVDDIDDDGDSDVISSLNAHEWGLAWFEQTKDGDSENARQIGNDIFLQHTIMGTREEEARYGVAFSQPHALAYADINGDGHKDIITGKRMWAHGPTGDVEPNADPVLYWFEWSRDEDDVVRFIPHEIDLRSGVGVQLTVTDINGDGRNDILTASKLGAFVLLNRG